MSIYAIDDDQLNVPIRTTTLCKLFFMSKVFNIMTTIVFKKLNS